MKRSVSSLDDDTSPPTLRGRRPWDRIAGGCRGSRWRALACDFSSRGSSSQPQRCGGLGTQRNIMRPLRYNPVVAQVAQIVNRSTDTHLTRPQRESRSLTPLEGLKDLGCGDTTWLR
jgi:hypothetical protein